MLPGRCLAVCAWLPVILFVSLPRASLTNFNPETQAKIGVSLESANVFLDQSKTYLQEQAKTLDSLKLAGTAVNAEMLRKYIKLLGKVSTMLISVTAFAAVFSVASTFFMPSQLEVIQENFDKVNKKLDGLSWQMNSIKDELKTSIEYNSWFTTYIDWELDIRNGDIKLNEIKNKLRNSNDEKDKLKLFEIYVNYFETQDIDGKSNKIYQLTALESITTKNLFNLFNEK